jgi:hypothetical protein
MGCSSSTEIDEEPVKILILGMNGAGMLFLKTTIFFRENYHAF